jgi:hypothetical protein
MKCHPGNFGNSNRACHLPNLAHPKRTTFAHHSILYWARSRRRARFLQQPDRSWEEVLIHGRMSDAGLATSAMRGGGRRARILGHRRGSFSAAASITANPTFHEWDVQLVNDPWVPPRQHLLFRVIAASRSRYTMGHEVKGPTTSLVKNGASVGKPPNSMPLLARDSQSWVSVQSY